MMYSDKDIVQDIDETLDQLLENAAVLEDIQNKPFFSREKEALEKTQESLLAHLVNRQSLLEEEKSSQKTPHGIEKIREKYASLEGNSKRLLRRFSRKHKMAPKPPITSKKKRRLKTNEGAQR